MWLSLYMYLYTLIYILEDARESFLYACVSMHTSHIVQLEH